ncbi:unnamed protein product [Effrenium voratum]|nr:unnamed protein product [Effrenium voratum]
MWRCLTISWLAEVLSVPRESPDFNAELHVPDMSSSEEVPQVDRRESEKGCHWTSRLKMELCGGDGCHESEILAFDFQRRAWEFYEGKAAAPPLEEAFLIKTMPLEEIHGAFSLCPGMVVTGLLLAAEAASFAAQPDPNQDPLHMAKSYMQFLYNSDREEFDTMTEMWPVLEGQQRAQDARQAALHALPASVDIVIARCSTTLRWLWSLPLPPQARVFIYSKCPGQEQNLQRQLEGAVRVPCDSLQGLLGRVAQIVDVPLEDSGEWMTGECTVYLRHMLHGLASAAPVHHLADYTIFIHDDAPRHLKPEFLSIVFKSLAMGSYNVDYLNLAHERYVAASTPCLKSLFRMVFGEDLTGRLSTYCCGHFVVSSSRLKEVPQSRLENLWAAVATGAYTALKGGLCEVANMPCYVVEYLWHAVLGEPNVPPWRSEDARLPLALRYEGGRDTRLPSPLKFSPYMQAHLA